MESRIPDNTAETLPTPEQVEEAQRTLDRLREVAYGQAREADRLVRQYPWQSLGIAAGFGLLVGLIISRR